MYTLMSRNTPCLQVAPDFLRRIGFLHTKTYNVLYRRIFLMLQAMFEQQSCTSSYVHWKCQSFTIRQYTVSNDCWRCAVLPSLMDRIFLACDNCRGFSSRGYRCECKPWLYPGFALLARIVYERFARLLPILPSKYFILWRFETAFPLYCG